MDSNACGKMGLITLTYYLWTTFMAVTVGIILVTSIHPGAAAQKEEYAVAKAALSSADALLDLIRYFYSIFGISPDCINTALGYCLWPELSHIADELNR